MQFKNNRDTIGKYTLLTIFLSLCTAMASLGISSHTSSDQELMEKNVSEYSDLLARNIQEHAFRLQMELFELNKIVGTAGPEVQDFIKNKVKEYDAHTAQLENDKILAKKMREDFLAHSEASQQHQKDLRDAVLWMQGAILVGAVATMLRKRLLWFMSFLVGLVGIVRLAKGYLPWF